MSVHGSRTMNLYPYQQEGVAFLKANKRAYLADEMGLGKTVQAIVAASWEGCRNILVVCPASVRENWKREWELWAHTPEAKLEVISYSSLIRRPDISSGLYDLVILDEAHYCKSPSAKRTKAAMKVAARADRAWLLSGTPVPNDARELWPAVKALWPEIAEKYGITTAFGWMNKWCRWVQNEWGYRILGNRPVVKTELVPELKRIMLRRKLKDIALELPPLRTTVQYLDRDPKLDEKIAELTTDFDDPEHLSTLRRLLGEYKAPHVGRVIREELASDPSLSIVVMYHHKATGEMLREDFHRDGILTVGFDGSTPPEIRQNSIDYFQHGGARVFLAQQTAAGVGITLTRASEIVLVEPAWSPSENEQAIKRIHRIGQDAPCRARLFAVPDSMDEALMATLLRKEKMVDGLVG